MCSEIEYSNHSYAVVVVCPEMFNMVFHRVITASSSKSVLGGFDVVPALSRQGLGCGYTSTASSVKVDLGLMGRFLSSDIICDRDITVLFVKVYLGFAGKIPVFRYSLYWGRHYLLPQSWFGFDGDAAVFKCLQI